ncbi:MAG TPA: AbrB/MazE/SpoVT family DNA-binding domain-containing protein [Anaerolineae bacterium]|nr:AbrB/MazE/SpoVT family DNA-binding domain-containing protein [Anaerolineae bacterium]
MLVKLSSKGQLVIPKPIREALGLRRGTRFHVQVDRGRIILEPQTASPADALYGKYADADFLTELEEEHQQEIRDEAALRA